MSASEQGAMSRVAREGIARQKRAANPAASTWVAASAGSGKTRVLVDRTLRLLLGGTPPERILCITFTKAAAAEMANRMNAVLSHWVISDADDLDTTLRELTGEEPGQETRERARRLFASVLDAPGRIKIQTIHSFCESLLGRFPLEARIAPHFSVIDEREAAELLMTARDRVLLASRSTDASGLAGALETISGIADETTFAELLAQMTTERGRFLSASRTLGGLDGLMRRLRASLGLGEEETEDGALHAACAEGTFDRVGLAAAARAMIEGSKTDCERGARIAAWLGNEEADRRVTFGDYAGAFLKATDGGIFATLIHKKALRIAPGADEVLRAEAERVRATVETLKSLRVWRASQALFRLGFAVLDAYRQEKARAAVLDYDDLIAASRRLLTRPGIGPWVLYKLDGGLDHVLVDEAQDTSPEQWDVIRALVDEFFSGESSRELVRTLFVVGDEKQSIFSFQGADVDSFQKMRDYFSERANAAEREWQVIPLELSFRSTDVVLDIVDRVFADDAARDGVSMGGTEIVHQAFRERHAGRVELWPAIGPEEQEASDPWSVAEEHRSLHNPAAALASRIAMTIRGWIDNQEELASRGRLVRPGDVMILVRRRERFFEEMVRALKLLNIPVAGADRMVLGEQLAVMDLAAIGHFVLLPEDDLTLATVLKGPILGYDDDDLFDIAHGRKGTLWAELIEAGRAGRTPHAEALRLLHGWRASADYATPHDFYAEILNNGGRRDIISRLGAEAEDPIDEFQQLTLEFQRNHAPSLQGFLHWFESAELTIKRDLEQGRDQVRVLTVHGAKGLQAPIVFLPDTCQVPRRAPAIFWDDRKGPEVPLWPIDRDHHGADIIALKDAAEWRRMAEYRRLLYVALTRAEDRLHVSGWHGRNGRSAGCWYDMIEAALEETGESFDLPWGERGIRLESPQSAPPKSDGSLAGGVAGPGELPAWGRRPAPPEPVPSRPLAPSVPVTERTPARSPLSQGGPDAYLRGRLIHRLLQTLPDLEPKARRTVGRRWLLRAAPELSRDAADGILREVLAVLEDEAFAALFGSGSRAEVPIVGIWGDSTVSGQIDRLAVESGRVLIVDYKTNRPPPARIEEADPAYLRQMALYRAMIGEIYPDRTISCALLWTDAARLMEVPPALMDAALA